MLLFIGLCNNEIIAVFAVNLSLVSTQTWEEALGN
jgi:hypothetical protein